MAVTTLFNVTITGMAGLAGLFIARYLGPTFRGYYAGATAWFVAACVVGEIGQSVAICYYVAKDPGHAKNHVRTSQVLMLATGTLSAIGGWFIAPILARHNSNALFAYRLLFSGTLIAYAAGSAMSALQGRDLLRWNLARLVQPAVFAVGIGVLIAYGRLSLRSVIVIVVISIACQAIVAQGWLHKTGLSGGQFSADLVRPLASFGFSAVIAQLPEVINTQFDRMVLVFAVSSAALGRYALAVSLTVMVLPMVTAFGYVALPRLASGSDDSHVVTAIRDRAILGSLLIGTLVMLLIAVPATWYVPLVFGAGYRGAVPLIWILAPGGVLLAVGYVMAALLRGLGRPLQVARVQGVAAILTLVMLAVLIPLLGATGAAITSTISYSVVAFLLFRCLRSDRRGELPNPSSAAPA